MTLIIDSYTRQDAIEDEAQFLATGELAKIARSQGYKYPVYYTRSVQFLIDRAVANSKSCNDWNGVFHDIFCMSKLTIIRRTDTSITFRCNITGTGRKSLHEFILQCGPTDIDNFSPAMTLMLPEDY